MAGIRLGAHWSVLVVASLIAWTLGAFVLPELEPGYRVGEYWAVGIGAALLFFASLLAHELGHSVIARRQGIAVDEITLWLLGGVSKLGSDSRNAVEEMRMAAIGPGISLALGFAFGTLAASAQVLGVPRLLVAGLAWLGGINVLLGVFNLLPAFPLDGGRLLRAFLWWRRGDRVSATQSAARAGQAFGYGLIALGVAEALFGGIGGLWLVLIGWFVIQAAQAEASMVVQRELLADVRIRDVMTRDPVVVPEAISVQELIERFVLGARHSAYPVTAPDGRAVGIVTLDQVRQVPPAARGATTVGSVAVRPPAAVTCTTAEAVTDVLARMASAGARRALVVEHDRVVGIVSMTDVARMVESRALLSPTARRTS